MSKEEKQLTPGVWKPDPLGRPEVEKVSDFLELPVFTPQTFADFIKFWNEVYSKIDTNAKGVKVSVENIGNNKQDKNDPTLNTTSKNVVGAINELNDSLNNALIGSIVSYPSQNIPLGWLLCNGSQVNESDYPDLAKILGATGGKITLPDLRGQFVRGLDNGKGIDTGRTMLSEQGDTIRNITGRIFTVAHGTNLGGSANGVFEHHDGGDRGNATGTGITDTYSFDASRVVPTSNENRPKNIALNYIIKAKNVKNVTPSSQAIDELNAKLNSKLDKGTYEGLASELWSNENCPNYKGNYGWIKFKNGILIQWGILNPPVASGYIVAFPLSFTAIPCVQITTQQPNAVSEGHTVRTVTTSNFTGNTETNTGERERKTHWIAIGY